MKTKPIKLAEVHEGMTLVADKGFTCMGPGNKSVFRDKDGPYIFCNDGRHYLAGQEGDDGYLVGLTARVANAE